jgi:hypothetical protein
VRVATSSHLTTSIALGAIAAGMVLSVADRPANKPPTVEIAPPADRELEPQPSSSSVSREPPPPPEGPFYASLFVAGATWDLPCRWEASLRIGRRDDGPTATKRCRVEAVEVHGDTASARIACGYVEAGAIPHPAVNTYVMTPTGLYMAAESPSTRGEPRLRPHPVAKSLPARWRYEEPRDFRSATVIVRHHDAWCIDDEFESTDYFAGYTECISRHGIVGSSHRSMGTLERCGDVPE